MRSAYIASNGRKKLSRPLPRIPTLGELPSWPDYRQVQHSRVTQEGLSRAQHPNVTNTSGLSDADCGSEAHFRRVLHQRQLNDIRKLINETESGLNENSPIIDGDRSRQRKQRGNKEMKEVYRPRAKQKNRQPQFSTMKIGVSSSESSDSAENIEVEHVELLTFKPKNQRNKNGIDRPLMHETKDRTAVFRDPTDAAWNSKWEDSAGRRGEGRFSKREDTAIRQGGERRKYRTPKVNTDIPESYFMVSKERKMPHEKSNVLGSRQSEMNVGYRITPHDIGGPLPPEEQGDRRVPDVAAINKTSISVLSKPPNRTSDNEKRAPPQLPIGGIDMYSFEGPKLIREMKEKWRKKYGEPCVETESTCRAQSVPQTDSFAPSKINKSPDEVGNLTRLPTNLTGDLSHILPSVLKARPRGPGRRPARFAPPIENQTCSGK